MTYTTETQTVEAFGVSYTEIRYQPEVQETQLITIEFIPDTHPQDDYGYSHPQFAFTEAVAIREQLQHCLENELNLTEELDTYQVRAIELMEYRNPSGRLTEVPHWCYGIRCQQGTKELVWFEEDELISQRDIRGEWEEF